MSAPCIAKQVEYDTFHECYGKGFDLLRRNILDREWQEINDTIAWLESETRDICKAFDECLKRAEDAEAKLNGSKTQP